MKPDYEPPAERFMRLARLCRTRDLKQLFVLSELVRTISELIHALQKERGASSIFIGSNAQDFAALLAERRVASVDYESAVRQRLEQIDSKLDGLSCGTRFYTRVALALLALDSLPAARAKISALTLPPKDALKIFTDIIASLLAVSFEAADIAADPDTSRALIALVNFAQGKEYAGQERAVGGAAFSRRHFDTQDRERLRSLAAAQSRAFQVFCEFAAREQVAALLQLDESPDTQELKRMRLAALDVDSDAAEGVSAAQWYEASTRRIDQMKIIEDRVTGDLERLCAAKLADVQDANTTFSPDSDAAPGALAVLFADAQDAERAFGLRADAALPGVEGPLRQPLHSILDVVEAQSRRIDAMSSQLESARQALAERKVIERAKGLLMRSRRMAEKDAYTLMRQTAMNQNKRMIEVAEAIVSMEDLLKA
jgi:hypothetical protein